MGALVLLSLLAAIPACALAALGWARVSVRHPAEENARRIAVAARWTAVALLMQGVSLLATVYIAMTN